MFRCSTLADRELGPARNAAELLDVARRCAVWDDLTIVADDAEFPQASVSWHDGHGFVVHCFEDAESWGYFLADSAELSSPTVDIVHGGQAQERWPRELFVSSAVAEEALDHFLQTGQQKRTLVWLRADGFRRETVWEGRAGREAWLKGPGTKRADGLY